jgi:flagellar FliJ protein
MSVIEKLIRFHKFDLDEKRRILRNLEEQEARIQQAIDRIDQEVESEQAFARRTADFAPYYGGYATRTKDRREGLEVERGKVHGGVEDARETVVRAFEELKKYEITKDQDNHRAYLEEERQDQIELDEIALTGHLRKSTSS